MLSLLAVAERLQKGPKMDEKQWDMTTFKHVTASAQKYGLKYPHDGTYFNFDDDLPGAALEAAIAYLVEMGLYCVSNRRILKFDEQEIRTAIRDAPNEVILGEGRDARLIRQRSYEGWEHICQCPGHHAPFSEEMASLIVKNWAQIAHGDYLEGFNFTSVDGLPLSGMAMEAYAARREVAWMREGIRKAGRPGMAIAYYPINTTASALIAPMDPDYGLRRTDGILLSTLPDAKIELDMLTAAIVYEDYGCFKINGGADGTIGGFFGGAEGAVIESLVKTIGGWLAYRDVMATSGAFDLRYTTAKKMEVRPEKMWAASVVLQALNQETNFITLGGNASQAGPGTAMHLVELGIMGVQHAINGAHLYMNRQGRARMNASQTPLEAEFQWEVAMATVKAGIKRKEGNRIIKELAAIIEGQDVENGPDHINDCYDLVHHKPKEAYHRIYLDVRQKFREAGIPL